MILIPTRTSSRFRQRAIVAALFGWALGLGVPAEAQIVKCTDPDGNVTYQSGKCVASAKSEKIDVTATPEA